MALDMTTALTIRAKVDGTNEVNALNAALGKTSQQATSAAGAFGKLGQVTGKITAGVGSLIPAAALAGLAAIAKRTIDAADNLNDLSQRTGVAVESLSRFGNAAADSGSSVDEVAKAMSRLARGVVDPASKTSEALRSIGISAVDANGKVKSLDEIMLSISDVFAKLPDGAEKAALAQELFGKSGVNLIPLLNQGREALSQYSATIDTELAQASDKFNDTLNAIGIALAGPFSDAVTALLPAITAIAEALVGLIQGFSALPEPLQSAILIFGGLVTAFAALAPAISAVISIITTIGPAIGTVIGALTGSGGLLAAIAAVFSGPVGWVALAVAAGIAIYAFRDDIAEAFKAIGEVITAAAKLYYNVFIKPVVTGVDIVIRGIKAGFSSLASILTAPFTAAINVIKNVFRGLLQFIANGINTATRGINVLIAGYNRLPAPDIPTIPQVTVPAFAAGGVVSGPTLAMVGEAGPEYIIPEHKMAKAATNYLSGLRGSNVIPAFASGGYVGGPGGFALSGGPGDFALKGGAANTTVQITTGPVLQQDSQRYVTVKDLELALKQFGDQIFRNNRSYGGRRYQGAF
jgi:TP901 family phage tail tape measure protein